MILKLARPLMGRIRALGALLGRLPSALRHARHPRSERVIRTRVIAERIAAPDRRELHGRELERRAAEGVTENLGRLSRRIGVDLHRKLEKELQSLSRSMSTRIAEVGESMHRMNRAALGRADLLHTELETMREAVDARFCGVENDSRRLDNALDDLRNVTAELRDRWRDLHRRLDAEVAATRESMRELEREIGTQIDDLALRHSMDISTLRAEQDAQAARVDELRDRLAKRIDGFSMRLGDVSNRINRTVFETEELLGVGRGRPGLLARIGRRLIEPFRWARMFRAAFARSLQLQRMLVHEMVEFGDALRDCSRELAPRAEPTATATPTSPPEARDPTAAPEAPASASRFDPRLLDQTDTVEDEPEAIGACR